jgi:hypothetical protein
MDASRALKATIMMYILLTGLCTAVPAGVIYVDGTATGTNDGSSWVNAYRYLQDALTDANELQTPMKICVARGTYTPDKSSAHPDGTGDRDATFYLLDNVAIKGGFAGTGATEPNARDIALYETVLSGDLAGNDAAIVDACDLPTEPTRGENSYTVMTAKSCSRTAVLDGLTIRSGNADIRDFGRGGGLALTICALCCPSVRNCTFIRNSASGGGAVMVISARPELINCTFVQNAAALWGGAIGTNAWRCSGGAASSMCDFAIKGCIFAGNHAQDEGGAIHAAANAPSVIEGCTFTKNSATNTGGAIHYSFIGMSVAHCRFLHNVAHGAGGAIYLDGTGLNITSCTLFGNRAPTGRALAALRPSTLGPTPPSATMINTILWNGGDGINVLEHVRMRMAVTYSDIEGGWPGEGNIDVDPLFANPVHWSPDTPHDSNDPWVAGDYHLKSEAGRWDPNSGSWVMDDVTSPCIDAGDPNSPAGDEPQPNGGRINMGVYGGTTEASKSYIVKP